jgi:hypothetical protein
MWDDIALWVGFLSVVGGVASWAARRGPGQPTVIRMPTEPQLRRWLDAGLGGPERPSALVDFANED